jgi:hypothetical protein
MSHLSRTIRLQKLLLCWYIMFFVRTRSQYENAFSPPLKDLAIATESSQRCWIHKSILSIQSQPLLSALRSMVRRRMKSKSLTLAAIVAVPTAMGFQASSRKVSFASVPLPMASTGFQEDESYPNRLPTQQGKKMSESIPFWACPKVLQESDLAGNVGFDPLNFAKNKDQLWEYREAEIKHARLAMLAAVGWPISEVMDRKIADFFNAPTMLDDGDRVPSVLNGGAKS